MDYCLELLNEVNAFCGSDEQGKRIRNLICYISDNEEIDKTEDVKELLFEASQLIRVFGYNKLNNLDNNIINENNKFSLLKNDIILNTYQAKSNKTALLDKKQKEIIDTFQSMDKKRIFVSAPTSFGKTHLLKEMLYLNKETYNNVVLIFPTIALLSENMDSITDFVAEHNMNYAVDNTFHDVEEDSRNIFILTPERAIMIFEESPKIKIDFFFFDEVYKIDEDFNSSDDYDDVDNVATSTLLPYSRAVAFRLVLHFLAKYTKDFYLAGPYISIESLANGMKYFIEKYNVTTFEVNAEATLKSYIKAWKKKSTEKNIVSGEIDIIIEGEFDTKTNTVQNALNYIDKNNLGQTLIYCDAPSRTVRYAENAICKSNIHSGALQEFIDHLTNRYSVQVEGKNIESTKEWSLIKILKGSIGLHHGKLPKYVQREILNFFNKGELSALFCTSTLIEGVNTIAKNIIVASSVIRNNRPLNQFDIKNIIGRAGRYYHHFVGRVFFIDKKQELILRGESQRLDMPIYNHCKLAAEDVDNVNLEDLHIKNQTLKGIRDEQLDKNILPDEVFVKNRLFDRLQQQNLLLRITENFEKYHYYLEKYWIVKEVLNKGLCELFFSDLCAVDIISARQITSFLPIVNTYYWYGISGLLNYEINVSKQRPTIDKAYRNVFNTLKTVIEYRLPRYYTLLQSLFNYCAKLEKVEVEIDLSNTIRFFEVGVNSAVGAFLVEHGLSIDAVRQIEKKCPGVSIMDLDEGMKVIDLNKNKFYNYLDSYEKRIVEKYIV